MAKDIFDQTLSALREVEAHASGETLPDMVVHVPETVDVAQIREGTGKAQLALAGNIGVRISTFRD